MSQAEPGFPGPRRVGFAAALRGELRVPSDKSIAHRALLFNAMASGEAEVTVRRPGADVRATASVLHELGAMAGEKPMDGGATEFWINGAGSTERARLIGSGGERLDCRNSGTTARLMAGALAGRGAASAATLVGDESLSGRPMERVAVPLRAMGADVETTNGRLPMHVRGGTSIQAMAHRLPVASAQIVGAVTLAALAADGRTTIETPGPTRDHTERLLGWLGAPVSRDGVTTTIDGPAGFAAQTFDVPGDISSAAAWLVAGSIHPDAEIRLPGVGLNPSRLAILDVLREMGAKIDVEPSATEGPEPEGTLLVRVAPQLHAIELSGDRIAELIDELPLLAVAMAAAEGTSEVRDATELRVKESDRVALVVRNLRAIGVDADELPDGWRIRGIGRNERKAESSADSIAIETAGDHRIAIAFAVAALSGVATEVSIDDPHCVDVSYPGFWDDLESVAGREPAVAPAR